MTDKNKKKDLAKMYQKKSQIEHILLRPDTYIGSIEVSTSTLWVWDESSGAIIRKEINYVPGLYKIFDEILVNAVDNFHKCSDTMDTIKVKIDREANLISVWNNGDTIPVEIHPEEKLYRAELIFGHLLTSSNYDDDEEKVTGGRNGYGAKLTNIYSKEFTVETGDSKRKKLFKQVFKNNMSEKSEPKITEFTGKSDYTKISFSPDLERFHMKELDDDIISLMIKRVYDVAGITPSAVKVYLNDKRIEIKDFRSYVEFYFKGKEMQEEQLQVIHEKNGERWEY